VTQAVCFKCGEIKFGAFVACNHCGDTPSSDDDLVLSLAMTDHYFALDVMRQMGQSIKQGTRPHLDEETRKNLLENLAQLRKSPIGQFVGGSVSPKQQRKSKWWPF
jgi:hypothetical protein